MFLHKIIILLFTVANAKAISNSNFETFVKYVEDYLKYIENYELPTNNSYMYLTENAHNTEIVDPTYDFIIIGGGTAGALLAGRLSENWKFNVLLLEAGTMEDDFTDIPAMSAYTPNSHFNWGYKTVPQKNACQGMSNQQCDYPRGRGLGGSGLINAMIYARGNREDFDNWSRLGNKGWSYKDILKYLKKSEHDDTGDVRHNSIYHGYKGPFHINYTFPNPLGYDEFLEAAKQSGLVETDINGRRQMGIQKIPLSIKYNKRQNSGKAFVKPVLYRKNLKLTLKAFVTKLIIEGDIVVGVEYVKDNTVHKAMASKEVILSAGSINSPQLLMLSGIGPKEQLEKHNIEVKVDLPVGKYLTDHPCLSGIFLRTNQTYIKGTLTEYLKSYLEGQFPLTAPFGAQKIAFLNTRDPGQAPPNVELVFTFPPIDRPTQAFLNSQDVFSNYNDVSIFVVVTKPKSRGSVTLQSNSPVDFPLVDPAYFTDPDDDDFQVMYEALQFVINLSKTEAMRAINATIITDSASCEQLKSISELRYWTCVIKDLTQSIYHPTGTTRMGVSLRNSVIDSELRVHNVKRLRVCDAGSLPEIVAGHPVAAVMAVAEKLADMLKIQYR